MTEQISNQDTNQVITYDILANAKNIPNNKGLIEEDNISSNYISEANKRINKNKDANEQNSQTQENCLIRFKKNNTKLFFIIISLVCLLIILTAAYFIYKYAIIKGKCKDDNCKCKNGDCEIIDDGIYASNGEKLVVKINREKDQSLIVNETILITSKYVDNENNTNETIEDPIYHKYLLNIYDEEIMNDKGIKYYAYVLLLKELEGDSPDIIAGNNIFDSIETENARNLKKQLYEEYLSENQDGINEEEELEIQYGRTIQELLLLNLSPLVKFSFFENGTVYEISKPKKIDSLLYANIENFIWKNIPSLSDSLYKKDNSKRNLEEKGIIREFSSDDKTNTVNLKEIEKTSISFSDSKANSETDFQIDKDGNLNEIKSYATLESISDSNNQIEDIPITGPFSNNDIKDEDQNIIQSPVLSVSNIIKTQMNLESITINETVKETIEKIIKDENIEFESVYLIDSNYNGKNERRKNNKLNEIKQNDLFTGNLSDYPDISQLKNLENLDGFSLPIMFSYSLYKSNIVGVKVGMSALVKFVPKTLTSYITLIYNTNGKQKVLLEKTETPNIGGSFDLMNKVIDQVVNDLIRLSNSIKKETKNWVNKINKELKIISTNIKKFDDISKIFIEPLNTLIGKIKKYDNEQFEEIHQKINETENQIKQLIQNVSSNPIKEINIILIKEETSNSFHSFISELVISIDDFHKLIKSFIESLTESLINLYGKPIDISIYYSIIEELDLCSNIYTLLDEVNLRKSIEFEKGNYSSYINDKLTELEIEEILILNENIAKRLQTNETLKQSIEENDRNDMINKLNSFRTQITNIIKKIQSHINNTYDNAINSFSTDTINNNKNEFEELKKNLFKELENVANGANNFLFHVNDLESISEINTNIFKKRNELFSKYMIKELQSVTNSYLTKSKLNSIDNEIRKYSEKIINEVNTNKENNFSNLRGLVDQFKSKVKEIDINDMNQKLYSNIFNIFNDTHLVNSMYSNYYTELNPEFQKLNNTFFKQIFEKNLKYYLTDPVELKYLLSQMLEAQLQQKDIINKKMTSLIYTYIKLMITYSYQDFISLINKNINYITKNIPNDNFENEALQNINYFKNEYQNLINYENSQLKNLIILTEKSFNSDPKNLDPLKISIYTKQNEKTLSIFVKQICDNVNTSYYNEYIYMNDDSDIKELDANQKENYYNAVFRYGVNIFKSIFSESSTIVSKDSIQGLNAEDYINEYNSIGNYNKDQIINSIISYLRDLTNEEMALINPYLENNFNDIKSVIDKNINEDIINGKIKLIISKVFVIEAKLKTKMNTIIGNLKDKIKSGFLQEEDDYNGTSYFFNLESMLNNYKKQYIYLKNVLEQNIKEIIKLIQYNEEYQTLIYNYFVNSQQELMTYFQNIISENTIIFSNLKLLNLTLNFNKISLEHFEKIKSKLLVNIFNLNELIFNSFNDFIYITLNDTLQVFKNSILSQFNDSYNIFENNVMKNSVIEEKDAPKTIKYFSKKLNDTLLDNLNIYIRDIKSTLNPDYFYEYIISQINNNLNSLENGKINLYDLDNTLISNGMSLKRLCGERFEKEKVLLNEQIYKITGENYKDNINNFINSYSSIYLDKKFEEIFTDRILYQLEYSQLQITDNKNFLLNIINKLSSIQQPIYNSLIGIFTKMKEEYTNNLIKSTEDNFYVDVDEFNIKSGEEITKKFIEEVTKLLNSDNFAQNFNKVIIENIPKSFSEGFYNEMLEFYKQNQKNNINNLKNKFLTEITDKGKEIVTLITNCQKAIVSKLPEPEINTDSDILEIEIAIEDFIEEKNVLLNNTEKNLYIKISNNKKQAFESLFSEKIKTPINEIISLYNNSENKVKDKFNNDILSFGDCSENFNINSFIEATENSYSVIENTRNEIINLINDKVNNFSKNIETKLDYDLNCYFFKKCSNNRRLSSLFNSKNKKRKLEEKGSPRTDLVSIKDAFLKIEENLYKINNELQISTEYSEFNSEKNMLISKIQQGIDHLKDPIKSSLNLLKDYLSEEQYNSFEENLNNQADKIIEELEKFVKEENKILTKITNYIDNDNSTTYVKLIVAIKAIIDTLLLTYFDKIFKKLKQIKVNKKVDNLKTEIKSYTENVYGRRVTFKNSPSNYGFSYIINLFYKEYKMYINIEVSGYSEIDSYYSMTNHRYSIKGRIGDGTIGINAIEDFTNGKTDVKAYINNKAVTYYHIEKYHHNKCFCRRRNLRGLLRALCGHWHTKKKAIKTASKFKTILKYY